MTQVESPFMKKSCGRFSFNRQEGKRKKKTTNQKPPALDDDPFSPPQQKDKEFYLPEVASDSAHGPEVPLMGT